MMDINKLFNNQPSLGSETCSTDNFADQISFKTYLSAPSLAFFCPGFLFFVPFTDSFFYLLCVRWDILFKRQIIEIEKEKKKREREMWMKILTSEPISKSATLDEWEFCVCSFLLWFCGSIISKSLNKLFIFTYTSFV